MNDPGSFDELSAANEKSTRHLERARSALRICFGVAAANFGVWLSTLGARDNWLVATYSLFSLLAFVQLVAALSAIAETKRAQTHVPRVGGSQVLLGVFGIVGAVSGWTIGSVATATALLGGAWGRPLRVRGRQLHPELARGSDWTRGARPEPVGLDADTRRALEALWLHDAQKEHASVPAFARIAWMLSAVGAPPELLRWAQRAALEEIDHTERCFALAAGYGGRSHTVEPLPELLLEGTGAITDALGVLVMESVKDGCQLEDFNADIAALCAQVCEEPVTRAVLEQIAREERNHAEFSWALVAWVLERDEGRARAAITCALAELEEYPRPTAVSHDKQELVARADGAVLRTHGRLRDDEWAVTWQQRLEATRRRASTMLGISSQAARRTPSVTARADSCL